ncbi:hypothetical protein ACFQJC_03945 [Haloferax namakaokahaiae]|uniref:CopG family transcriptional regulator n=1 Tax=Haloferax namakaokahaiae TaxID=1748331 RepID=A0ABD5ZBR3_9EURY
MADITISDNLVGRIEDRIKHTEFSSVDEYIGFVLSEAVTRVERGSEKETDSTQSREDVQSRLQSLGYLEE